MATRHTPRKAAVCIGLSIGFLLLSVSAASAKPPPPKRQADVAIAKASVLVIRDFPNGWRTQSSSNKEAEQVRAQTPECKNYEKIRKQLRSNPNTDAPEFAQGDQTYADNSVFVFADEQAATKFATQSIGSEFKACYLKSTKKIIEARLNKKNVHFDDVKVDIGDLSADQVGDATTALEAVVTVTQGSSSETLYQDLEVIRVGRALASFAFQNSFTQFPDLKTSLIHAVVSRLRQALGSGAAAPSPASGSRPFGNAATVTGGKVTVYSYEQPATGINQYQQPQMPGDEFSAVDAEICATGTGGLDANSSNFALQFPDNSQREPGYGKNPALNFTKVATGDCIRGWVTFEVPAGQRPGFVLYKVQASSGGTPPPIKWSVS